MKKENNRERVLAPLLTFSLMLGLAATTLAQPKLDVKAQMAKVAAHYTQMLATHPDTTKFPQSLKPDGSYNDKKSEWWCSGFFGASLWYLYEYTQEAKWKDAAHLWTMAVQKEQYNRGTHDLGFMIYCPFGNGLRLSQNPAYPPIMLQGAASLATRFDPERGVIQSWNGWKDCDYPVIIDNMMNLEFLFWASRYSGDKRFAKLSVIHADNTIKNHFRPDGSSFHVVCYNKGGSIQQKRTAQGAADGSAWARGQAWGLYGYVVMYRETKKAKYLKQALVIADFLRNHPNLPADKIPYWDFNAPNIPNEERDASAAAITASALLELQGYLKPAQRATYLDFAEQILASLSSPAYFAAPGENGHFLLKHSVGAKPLKSEVDTPLIYADYYYIEALLRYQALTQKAAKR
jgi:unsaturated chondroitin disaccharide hydrolase